MTANRVNNGQNSLGSPRERNDFGGRRSPQKSLLGGAKKKPREFCLWVCLSHEIVLVSLPTLDGVGAFFIEIGSTICELQAGSADLSLGECVLSKNGEIVGRPNFRPPTNDLWVLIPSSIVPFIT